MTFLKSATAVLVPICGVAAHAADGLVVVRSPRSAADTASRLAAAVQARGLKLFARIDHAAGGATVGKTLRLTAVFIFGDPKPYRFDHSGDPLGWSTTHDGRFNLGLFIEGGRIGRGRGLERQPDCGGVGHEHSDHRTHAPSPRGGGFRRGADTQDQSGLGAAAHI